MPRSLRPSFLLLLAAPVLFQSSIAQQPGSGSGVTLKTSANLVVVDVVVTDNHQKPVHSLKPSDFTLLENNSPQQVRNFEEHTAPPPSARENFTPAPTLPPGYFTNYSPVPSDGPLNVLLIDTLNTPLTDQAYVHAQILKYLKGVRTGSRIAIFGLTQTHLFLLQSFTADPELLRTAVNAKSLDASPLLDNPLSGAPTQKASDLMESQIDPKFLDPAVIADLKQLEAEQTSLQLQMRAKYTLDAMSQLARYLSVLPGRKNLIWFSGSFPINILPDSDTGSSTGSSIRNPFAVIASSEQEFRETTNLFSRSQVAVYPVDARGLFNSPMDDVSTRGTQPISAKGKPKYAGQDQSQFFLQTASEHITMGEMAQQTGGHAFINTNGLAEAVEQAINSGSNYYTLSYTPSNDNYNGNFRKIQIKLQQKGYTLAYRRGYYADSPSIADHNQDKPMPAAPDTVHLALMHGEPGPTQIILKIHVLPAAPSTTPAQLKLAAGNIPGPDPARTRAPYRSYLVDIAALPRTIAFTKTPDGHFHANVEYITVAYDTDGALITSITNVLHMNLASDTYARLLHDGLQFHQQISVPDKGNFYLRVGLHDTGNDHVGAIELPLAAVKNLPARHRLPGGAIHSIPNPSVKVTSRHPRKCPIL